MSNKNKKRDGMVYSTDPDFEFQEREEAEEESLPPGEQRLRVMLERKGRGGKEVTLVAGFVGSQSDREALVKKLKNYCGAGGSAADGEVMVQGDQRDKVLKFLLANGYHNSKRGN